MDDRIKKLALTMKVEPYSFNPFTDANDDYAVLEWMRAELDSSLLIEELSHSIVYQIGDWATAAVKIIGESE